jgi:hypothetical protein
MGEVLITRRGGSAEAAGDVGAGSGGTEVTSNGYKYHTFTSSSTFTVSTAGLFEVLAVAGGGGSVASSTSVPSGGGGAGELRNCVVYLAAGSHTITIGAGGAGDASIASIGGSTSVGDNMLLTGGGPVRSSIGAASVNIPNGCGACGAGASSNGTYFTYKGLGLVGFDGGVASAAVGGGGGGMGGPGKSYMTTGDRGGGGGIGQSFVDWATATSTGDSTYYAGGGAGQSTTGVSDPGGLGGGGDLGSNGSANTGGGAGAGNYSGGSGIVIIRYPTSA